MGVLCDHAIKELIDNGLIVFNRSEITYESVITQVNPNTLDLSLGRFVRWPKEHSGQVIYGNVDLDEYESAIVVAESKEDAIKMLKTSLEETHGEGKEEMWGNFDVTVKEVDLNEQKIILQMLCAG